MDHLPHIENLAYPVQSIPLLGRPEDYDGNGLQGFPERIGWKIDRERGPLLNDPPNSPIKSSGALLQTWLYFGVLHDVLLIGGLHFNMQDFVHSVNGEQAVTSLPLRGYLDQLAQNAGRLPSEECQRRQERVRNCLKTVFGFLELHWEASYSFNRWQISSFLSLDVTMSIVILGETIKHALSYIWPVKSDASPLRQVWTRRTQNPLRNRLLERGWCPNEAVLLFSGLDCSGLHLASLLKRPFAQTLSHAKCSNDECVALQTSESDYTTVHADQCPEESSCAKVSIDQSKLSSILGTGGIPVIYIPIAPDDGSPPKVRLLDYNSNKVEYIAFSHVWAHGLGNPKENSLPLCQILRLKNLSAVSAGRRFRQPAFWIDTLCIPVAPEYKSFRKLAITRLATTFRDSWRVLVLDADLQRTSKNCSRTELATRIMASGWMRRLWTLQEAVMSGKQANAAKVDIQFLDGAIEFNQIAGRSVKNRYHAEAAIASVTSAFPQYLTRESTFVFLAGGLRYRTTSRKEDEAICLASILGFDQYGTAAILNEITAAARMQKLYTLIENIPASVLFNRSRKLGNSGFRWAPASLLGSPVDLFPGVAARCDALGLHVQFSGYMITGVANYAENSSQAPRGNYYIANPQSEFPSAAIGKSYDNLMTTHQLNYEPLKFAQLATSTHDAIMKLDQLLRETSRPAVIINPHDAHESVLVSITSEEAGGVLHATFISRIFVRYWRTQSTFNTSVHEGWENHTLDVRELPSDQQWCVT